MSSKPLDFHTLVPPGTPFTVMHLQTTEEGAGGEVGLFFRMPIESAAQFPLGATGVVADLPSDALIALPPKDGPPDDEFDPPPDPAALRDATQTLLRVWDQIPERAKQDLHASLFDALDDFAQAARDGR